VGPKIVTATRHRDSRRGAAGGVPGGGSVRGLPVNHGSVGGCGRVYARWSNGVVAGPFLTCARLKKVCHRAV
jgi:hypothetical protein